MPQKRKKQQKNSGVKRMLSSANKKTAGVRQAVRENRRPLLLSVVAVFIMVLIAAQFIQNPQEDLEVAQEPTPISVEGFVFGDLQVSEQTVGTVKNLSAITLVAQSAGPVKSIAVVEGDTVPKGSLILSQETAYGAGNAAAVQRQIAYKNYQQADETLKNTVDSVSLTREQADLNKDNTDKLTEISEQSIDDTKALISIAEDQVKQLENMVATASASSQPGLRASLIAARSTLNSSRASLRSVEYEVDSDNPPDRLAEIAKELVYKSTEIQLKTAQIQQEIAALNLQAARISEATTRVSAPFEGVIEKVYVQPGEYVQPGTPVAVLRGDTRLCLQIPVSGQLIHRIDDQQRITVPLKDTTLELPINHISQAPVEGNLFEVLAIIPESYSGQIYDGQTLQVTLPMFELSQIGGNHFIPLDSVFVTSTEKYVYVYEADTTQKRTITTGEIVGTNIEVKEGLYTGETVIADRRVIDGQAVQLDMVEQSVVLEL